jgi:hypothetical protein
MREQTGVDENGSDRREVKNNKKNKAGSQVSSQTMRGGKRNISGNIGSQKGVK